MIKVRFSKIQVLLLQWRILIESKLYDIKFKYFIEKSVKFEPLSHRKVDIRLIVEFFQNRHNFLSNSTGNTRIKVKLILFLFLVSNSPNNFDH